ncbi:MAG TPA: DUF5660 family protein [Candidatus Saccharimonadales bacterium]|nr:DUF5660 family protein [Candidatus Saccharimonadales bacterium]
MSSKLSTRQKKQIVDINPVETLNKVGSAVANYTKEETKTNMKKFWEQLLGVGEYGKTTPQQGDMTEGQAIFFQQQQQQEQIQQEAKPAIRAAYDHAGEIIRVGETNKQETQQLQSKLNEIIGELQRLATVSVILEKEVIEATGQTIVNPGKYHLNFFEWLLIEIQQARIQVEDAGTWLATVSSKNGKKKNYWSMYKKHGTKFGLSGERSVSTQTA